MSGRKKSMVSILSARTNSFKFKANIRLEIDEGARIGYVCFKFDPYIIRFIQIYRIKITNYFDLFSLINL